MIEGFYNVEVTKSSIEGYFKEVTNALKLRMYGEPIIFSPAGMGKEGNQGFDAFVPLIDSGISLYVWSNRKFLSGIIYTCKDFDTETALACTKNYFKIEKVASVIF